MMWCGHRPPGSGRFFDAYQELNPSPPGWLDRMPVLFLRELMSGLAHGGDVRGICDAVHTILAPFRTR
jgi:fructosamine-3-kinase